MVVTVSSIRGCHTIGWLVLGWVFERHTTSVYNQPPWPTQPPSLCWTRNEYRPKMRCRWG